MASTMQGTTKKRTAARRSANPNITAHHVPTHVEIAERARELYEESGYAGGRDVEFWLEAERQLREGIEH